MVLLGGTPFDEEIVMWWNFIGRSHEDIVQAREDWEAASDRFGHVEGYPGRPPTRPGPAQRHHHAAPESSASLTLISAGGSR